jgi:hypothetical protein
MDKINDNLISAITVRLRRNDSSDSTIGTGVLYYEKSLEDNVYILTAAHCLFEDMDSFQKKLDSLFIDIYDPNKNIYVPILYKQIDENLLFKDSGKDIAVLLLNKEYVDKINPNLPSIIAAQERQQFSTFAIKGFPRATKGKELDMIQATWKQNMTESKKFQLQLESDYTEYNMDGFSGSGVFLEAEDGIFLYGIFTRFRAEEKGKVIYCQYIETINELLRNNYLTPISFTYLGVNGMTPSFFSSKTETAIKNLGARFNEKINLEMPIVKMFDCISKNGTYYKRFISIIDSWLTERNYIKMDDNELIGIIELELSQIKNELKTWLMNLDYSATNEIQIVPFVERIKLLNKDINKKQDEIYELKQKQCEESTENHYLYDNELARLRDIHEINYDFIHTINELYTNLVNHPTLIIQGEAGCGKSHLLGDIATQRKKQNLPTVFLLGTMFNNTTIEKNIIEKLDLTCSFRAFIESLNNIGLQINERVLIFIDAINEGAGADLWESQIAGFIDEIAKYPAVGLVLTIRNTYFDKIISSEIKTNPNITFVTYEGFRGNEYEALKLFCEHYNLKLPNIPILNPEFANPLFLHTICESVKDLPDKSFPKGFNGVNKIYSLYKDSLNKKFEAKKPEYKYQDIVSKAIEKLAVSIFNAKYHQLSIVEARDLFDSEFAKFPCLLSDLIEENVLIKMRNNYDIDNSTDSVFFSYQRLGDFFMAEELLKPYKTKKQIQNAFINDGKLKKIIDEFRWSFNGVIEAFSILFPEKYNVELFEFIDVFLKKDTNSFRQKVVIQNTYSRFVGLLLDSLKWRELSNINEKKITKWLEKNIQYLEYDEWLYSLTELAAIPNHPFNSDRLHDFMLNYTMSERDGFWQRYVRNYRGYNDNNIAYPLQRLLDWAWLPNISDKADTETARLVAQTLAWVLSSTDIPFRDKTTKALVNLLEQQPEALIKTLIAFENIDDMYIMERLYAVAYGCILRTEKDNSIKIIAQYIYNAIFKNGNPPVHILVRDYARNAIEYAIYKNVGIDIDEKLIRPPYRSQCNYTPLSNDELDEKYEPKDENGHWNKSEWGITAILSSMTTEYGRTTGGYGDFGRYTFQSALSNFNLPDKLNVDLLSNLAVEWIIEKYGYNPKLHGEYDSTVTDFNRYGGYRAERIGKKYQWIAFYEILAMVADNYKMDGKWSFDERRGMYKGAWQLYIRNIDPSYVTKNKDEEDEIVKTKENKEWWEDKDYNYWNFSDSEWVETIEDLIDPRTIIEKEDENGEKWLHLEHFVEWKEPKKIGIERYSGRKKQVWYIIQGLLVKKSDKRKIINYLKDQNFWGRWLPENEDDYSKLINREKFWSPAYIDTYKNNKKIWETIQDTNHKVIVATESANGGIENDESDANGLYNIPCKYIFEGMRLQYAPVDGYLKNIDDEITVMNTNSKSVLIRKKGLIQFLNENNLDIIWTVLGEKFSFTSGGNEESYFKVPCGVYYLEDGKLKGELKMYGRN